MIKVDPYIIEFVSGNYLGITLVLGLLKGVAHMTKSVMDNKISTLLGQTFRLIPKPQDAADE